MTEAESQSSAIVAHRTLGRSIHEAELCQAKVPSLHHVPAGVDREDDHTGGSVDAAR
ncbi:hypothetical protein ACVDG5_035880 [Mesorhizobium sp. ORM6]